MSPKWCRGGDRNSRSSCLPHAELHRQPPDQALQFGNAFKRLIPLRLCTEEVLGPLQIYGPPLHHDLLFQVVLTADVRQTLPASQ